MKHRVICMITRISTAVLAFLLMFPVLPASAEENGVDLRQSGTVIDSFVTNHQSTVSTICHAGVWRSEYDLFDFGSGAFMLYRVTAPAGQEATVLSRFKAWEGVGNGGVHQYSAAPKTRWYVTGKDPGQGFDGDVAGWTEVLPKEEISLQTYSYTYCLDEKKSEERTFYACLKFSDNDPSHSGKAGWNDGAWLEEITFAAGKVNDQPTETDPPQDESEPRIDLMGKIQVTDDIKAQKAACLAMIDKGRWSDAYALFDLGKDQYLLYRVDVPAGDGAQATIRFKNWTDVGNGGVHRYSSKFKTEWYVTENRPSENFDGTVTGWKKVEPIEKASSDLYTYTYLLADKESTGARTLYVCIRFSENQSQYHGMAGGNDGAWIESIRFDRLVAKEIPVQGLKLNPDTLTLAFGKSAALETVFTPADATLLGVTWESSDPRVVVVEEGIVTAVGIGSATVRAVSEDGGYTATCTITVPDDMPEICLTAGEIFDAEILREGDTLMTPRYSWYHTTGDKADSTSIVTWPGVTFRDFGSHACTIYKLKVPGGYNARIRLRMVVGYEDERGVWNGVLSGTEPRLRIDYTTDPITLATMDQAVWTRADSDQDWKADQADYAFSVSPMSSEDRYVYVRLYSTYAGAQGAWIQSLTFDTIQPDPICLYVKAPTLTEYKPGDTLDLTGLVVGVRYQDGTEAILSPNEYTLDHSGPLSLGDTEIAVRTLDGKLSASFGIHVMSDGSGHASSAWKIKSGWWIALTAGILLLGGGAALVILTRQKRKNGAHMKKQ